MKTPAPPSRPLVDLRELTPARVGLGRAGASMTTDALLAFTLDHARARDAVHTTLDVPRLVAGLAGLGLQASQVSSQAGDRRDYLRRPDLGRMLDQASRRELAGLGGGASELAGEKIESVLVEAPGNGAAIGGIKVIARSGWYAARPSGTEDIYKIYAESFSGAEHLQRILKEAQAVVDRAIGSGAAAAGEKGKD